MNTTTEQLLQIQREEDKQLRSLEIQDSFLIGLLSGAFLMCLVISVIGGFK